MIEGGRRAVSGEAGVKLEVPRYFVWVDFLFFEPLISLIRFTAD